MPLTIREGVELAKVGVWNASTTHGGAWNCTRTQIADAVRAGGRFRPPVIKPGHIDPGWDGEPALGRVLNLRASDDGNTLLGDLEIPDWLDEQLHVVYPDRSVEADIGVETADGETYAARMTGLALLGVTPPAVKGLADLQARIAASEDPEYTAALSVAASFVESQHPRGGKGTPAGGKFVAKGSGYASAGKGGEAGKVKELQAELVRLGLLGTDSGKHGGVDGLFGPKTEAAVKKWQTAHGQTPTGRVSDNLIATLKHASKADVHPKGGKVKAADADPAALECSCHGLGCSRCEQPPLSSEAGLGVPSITGFPRGASSVDVTPKMREDLGLDESADEAAVEAAIAVLKSKAAAPPPATEPPTPVVEPAATTPPAETPAAPAPADVDALVAEKVAAAEARIVERVAASYDGKLAALSGELAERKANEAAAVKARILASAQQEGKIAPAEVEQWSKDYDEAPTVTTRILASLKPGTAFPVGPVGYTGTEGDSASEVDKLLADMGWGATS